MKRFARKITHGGFLFRVVFIQKMSAERMLAIYESPAILQHGKLTKHWIIVNKAGQICDKQTDWHSALISLRNYRPGFMPRRKTIFDKLRETQKT